MARKPFPSNVLDQGQNTLDSWKEVDAQQTIGDLNIAKLEDFLTRFRNVISRMNTAQTQLNEVRNEFYEMAAELWSMIKRVRNGFKGIFGDDSYEYSLIGGTRISDRKHSPRKPKTPASE